MSCTFRFAHRLNRGLAASQHGQHIDIEHVAPIGLLTLSNRAGMIYPSGIDQNVEASMCLRGIGDKCAETSGIFQVECSKSSVASLSLDGQSHRLKSLTISTCQTNMAPFARQSLRDS